MTRYEWRHNFSLRLRQLMIDEGISQMELAEIIGVSGCYNKQLHKRETGAYNGGNSKHSTRV